MYNRAHECQGSFTYLDVSLWGNTRQKRYYILFPQILQVSVVQGSQLHRVSWVPSDIIRPFTFADSANGSTVENPTRRSWFLFWSVQQYFQLQSCCRVERNISTNIACHWKPTIQPLLYESRIIRSVLWLRAEWWINLTAGSVTNALKLLFPSSNTQMFQTAVYKFVYLFIISTFTVNVNQMLLPTNQGAKTYYTNYSTGTHIHTGKINRKWTIFILDLFADHSCVVSYIVIGRQQRGGTSQGSRFWIQGSVPSAEREADFGHPWAPVAWWSTQCPVSAGPWCSAYSARCGHQGRAGKEPVGLLYFSCDVTVACKEACVSSCRWQTVYVWCPLIRQRPYP